MPPNTPNNNQNTSQSQTAQNAQDIIGDQLDGLSNSAEKAAESTAKLTEENDKLRESWKYAGAGAVGLLSALSLVDGKTGQIAKSILTGVSTLAVETYESQAEIAKNMNKMLDPYTKLNESIGGITREMFISGEEMNAFSATAFKTTQDFQKAFAGIGDAAITFQSNSGDIKNAFKSLFPTEEDMGEAYSMIGEINKGIAEGFAIMSDELTEAERVRMVALSKATGTDIKVLKELTEKQFAFTGEASTDVIEKITATADVLATATGLPLQTLKNSIIEIKQETELFGNIGEDAAGRIAASLSMLGTSFQSFKAMTSQFMDFDSAAKKMGDLSAMFGIQMDAMEMTYLANEDQEEFLYRIREDILASGVDVENMSNARLRMLKSQLGMNSVEEVKMFLKEDSAFDEIGQEGIAAAASQAENLDGMTVAIKKFAETGNEALRSIDTERAVQMAAASSEMVRDLSNSVTLSGEVASNFQKVNLAKPENIQAYKSMLSGYNSVIVDGAKKLGTMSASTIQGVTDASSKGVNLITSTLGKFKGEIGGVASDLTATVQYEIDTAAINDAVMSGIDPTRDAIDQNTTSTNQLASSVGQLVTQMQQPSSQAINVNLDGQQLGSSMINIMTRPGVTNSAGQSLVVAGG